MDEGLTLKFCTSILRAIIAEAIVLHKMNTTSVSPFMYDLMCHLMCHLISYLMCHLMSYLMCHFMCHLICHLMCHLIYRLMCNLM
jgi:hypothetical protein